MQYTVSLIAFLAASATALKVTSPTNTTDVDFTKDIKVTWDTVSSDPTSFSIQVVNNVVSPSYSLNIADGVYTSTGSYVIHAGTITGSPGEGYQINLVSKDPNNTGILAQSGQFTDKVITSSAAPSATSGSAAAASASSKASGSASAASSASSVASSISSKASGSAVATSSPASGSATKSSASASATSAGAAVANGAPVAAAVGFFGVLAMLA